MDSKTRLKKSRKNVGLTLKELSDLTGGQLSVSRISNYEQGCRNINVEVANILAPHLLVTPAYLLCVEEPNKALGAHQEDLMRLLQQVALRGDDEVLLVSDIIKAYLKRS